jgi:CBS domain containing-hemolysin-like protein
MSTTLTTVGLNTTFLECLQFMDARKISHLIILDEQGEYYGMLSWRDLQQRLVKELSRELQEKKEQLNLLQEFAFGPNVKKAL